jgi:hypothetical protein
MFCISEYLQHPVCFARPACEDLPQVGQRRNNQTLALILSRIVSTEYNPSSVANVDFTTSYAKSRGPRRLPDEVDFADAPEGVLTPKKSQISSNKSIPDFLSDFQLLSDW